MKHIFVLIKEVPDMTRVKFDSEKGTVNRNSADAEMNPFDLNALQAAVDLKQICGCQVTAVDRKSTRLNSSHFLLSRMPSSA